MPLPAALLARLQKRGIVKQKPQETGPEEEVIAEDYDDHSRMEEDEPEESRTIQSQPPTTPVSFDSKHPAPNCPNKYSIYHVCTPYCFENWLPRPSSPGTERKRKLMMAKYPLPEDWQECFDPGLGRHYYWSTLTDEVSWLPPGHPRAKISLPANKLRAIVKAVEREEQDEESSDEDEEEEDEDEKTESNNKRERSSQRRGYHPDNRVSRGGTRREPELDPMDPASYGECGRGTWSTGLSRKGEAKTGADTTASGPLYQMRPYPSPGAILRMNAENTKPPPAK